jgi:hypothetical protein
MAPAPLKAQVSRLSHRLSALFGRHGTTPARQQSAPVTIGFYQADSDESAGALQRQAKLSVRGGLIHVDQVVGRAGPAEAMPVHHLENCGRAVRSQRDRHGEGFLGTLLGPSIDPPAVVDRGPIGRRQRRAPGLELGSLILVSHRRATARG